MEEQKNNRIAERLGLLRKDMLEHGVDYYLAVSTDPHTSEYVDDHFKVTEFFSGCTSDNAALLVDRESARLWTDGRYFISAAREMAGSGIELMRMGEEGVPTLPAFLRGRLKKGEVLGFNGRNVRASDGKKYRSVCARIGAKDLNTYSPEERIWKDRCPLSSAPVWILPDEISGRSFPDKLADLKDEIEKKGAKSLVISKLDDIMWLFNIRGGDVECNPVALSYALIGTEEVHLFLQRAEVTEEFAAYAGEHGICLHEYEGFFSFLEKNRFEEPVLIDEEESSDAVLSAVSKKAEVVRAACPVKEMKAVKNDTEILNLRRVYLEDSVQMCRFLFRMKQKIGREKVTEIGAAEELDSLRAELPDFLELSFPTISAYGPNAAMAHYAASKECCAEVKGEGFLLVDSGGQYMGGTTDVTRTIVCGALTEEMKRDFTLTAAANLRLMDARFAKGTSGKDLDILAREPLYRYGLDFNHGTGHGIGYILNVHEAPPSISKARGKASAPFKAGMIVSDEPGVYKEDRYGIRIESVLLCVPDRVTEFGTFLRFDPLTLVPIDLEAIDTAYLDETDLALLNAYHRKVYEAVSPFLEGEELEFLSSATRPVRKQERGA